MKTDFRKLTIEVFADRCQQEFGGKVAILPNVIVFKHCLHLSEFHKDAVELRIYKNRSEGTIYVVNYNQTPEQFIGINAYDGTTFEYRNEAEAMQDVRDGIFGEKSNEERK